MRGQGMTDSRRRPRSPGSWISLVIVVAVPAVLCALQLERDIWYDEAVTIDLYALRSSRDIVTDYASPNNHILYTLFLHGVLALSGNIVWLRLPNLLFAAIGLVGVFLAGRRLISREAGLTAVAAVGFCVVFLVHAMQLRGYGLSMAIASVLMAIAVRRRAFASTLLTRAAIVALVCIFVGVLPTNILFAASAAGASLLFGRLSGRSRRWMILELAAWTAGMLLGCGIYWPVADQLMKHRSALSDGFSAPTALIRIFEMFTRDMRIVLLVLLPLALYAIFLERTRWQRGRRFRAVPVVLLLCLGPFFLQALIGLRTPFDRTFTPVLPAFGLLIGWVGSAAVGLIVRKTMPRRSAIRRRVAGWLAPAVLAAALLPAWLSYPARLDAYRDQAFAQDGYYCYYAADYHPARAVAFLKSQIQSDENYVVVWDRYGNFVFAPYLRNAHLEQRRIHSGASPDQITIFYFAPVLANYEELAAAAQIPEPLLREFDDLGDFGFFHLFRKRFSDLRHVAPAGVVTNRDQIH